MTPLDQIPKINSPCPVTNCLVTVISSKLHKATAVQLVYSYLHVATLNPSDGRLKSKLEYY
jgi:hypothetical protein